MRSVTARFGPAFVLVLALGGCTRNNFGFTFADGGGNDLLGTGGGDLAGSPDLAVGGGDLAGGSADLAGSDGSVAPDLAPCATGSTLVCGPAESGIGVCRAGVRQCIDGAYGPCTGAVYPSAESCNGLDDDCNGTADDASALGTITCGIGGCQKTVAACGGTTPGQPTICTPGVAATESCGNSVDENCDGVAPPCGCTYVAPAALGGSDTTGTGTNDAPFATISKGIAMAGSNSLPKVVCVAAEAGSMPCGQANPASTVYAEAIVMRDGVSVTGGWSYTPAGGVWLPARGNQALQSDGTVRRTLGCETVIQAVSSQGVLFDHNVTTPTSLDGFTVLANPGPALSTAMTAAVTIEGSTGAVLNDNILLGRGGATATVAVNIDGAAKKATPILRRNTIVGGTGAVSIGVLSTKSAPVIEDQCDTLDASGRCTAYCDTSCYGSNTRFIRGRTADVACPTNPTAPGSTETYAIKLVDSPGAVVARNSICSSRGQGQVAGVRVSGDAKSTLLRANLIAAEGATTGNVNAVGAWLDGCAGASPWLFDNYLISSSARSTGARADGVRVIGDCHPRIDSNRRIVGGEEAAGNDSYGVYCGKDPSTGIASRCSILDNDMILGSVAAFPPRSAGIRCEGGSCSRIERNGRITGRSGDKSYGIILEGSGAFVAQNVIEAGCARQEGIGLLSINSFARVENNVIGGTRWTTSGGKSCDAGSLNAAPISYAVRVELSSGANEIDLHSNDLFALGTTTACTARAVGFDVATGGAPPSGPRGLVRNNVMHAGACATSYAVDELSLAADPRVLSNNDLFGGACGSTTGSPCSSTAPTALYRDEAGGTLHTTTGAVNAMSDITAAANGSFDPSFDSLLFPAVNEQPLPATAPTVDIDLDSGSMCIDNGTATQAPTVDWAGGKRPTMSGYDIGADER